MTVRKAAAYSIFGQALTKLLSLISVMIVARLLTPDELGVYAIAASIAFIASEFRNLGTASYLIREQHVDETTKRQCLGISFLISWSMLGTLLISAAFIESSYELDNLATLIIILSTSFIFAPLTVVPFSMLSKELRYGSLFFIVLSSQLTNIILTITLIYHGFSYFSMAISLAVSDIWRVTFFYLLGKQHFYFLPKLTGFRHIFNSGVYVSLGNLFKRFSLMCSDLVIGKIGSTREVALFSRAIGFGDFIVSLTTMGISSIALSYISKEKTEKGNVELAFIRATNIMLSIVWPALIIAIVLRHDLIEIFFGPQWEFAANIFVGIGLWMIINTIWGLSSSLFILCKIEKFRAYKEGGILLLTISAIYFSYPYGLITISTSLIFVSLIDFVINLWSFKVMAKMSIVLFISKLIPNIILTAICGLSTYFFHNLFTEYNNIMRILATTTCLLPIWLSSMFICKLELFNEVKNIWTPLQKTITGK